MKRLPSVRLSAAVLAAALLWYMIGAPVSAQDVHNLKTPLWQARTLLPQRLARVLRLWLPPCDQQTAEAETLTVYLAQEERMASMTLEGYVCGVVAAEMPAQYHMEALKAQAVAARTRVLRQRQEGGCPLHPGADICTDSAHCQGYATLAECRETWGDSFESYRDRLLLAQEETQGQWIAYEGEPITVLYHAISGGRTENVQTVFAQSLPYLVSVESSYEENARGFQQETFYTFEEMADRISAALPQLQCSAEMVQRTLAIGGYTESGRVSHVQLDGQTIEAKKLRKALELRSTWFSITADDRGVTFHQRGYGHGVGMSQAGANGMAAAGADYVQILKHYYTGVEIIGPEA